MNTTRIYWLLERLAGKEISNYADIPSSIKKDFIRWENGRLRTICLIAKLTRLLDEREN